MKFFGWIFILLSLDHLPKSQLAPNIMTTYPDMARSFEDLNFILHDPKQVMSDLFTASFSRREWLCRDSLLNAITFQVDQSLSISSDGEPSLGTYYGTGTLDMPTTMKQLVYDVNFLLQPGDGQPKSVKMAALLCCKIQGFYWFLVPPQKHTFPENYYLVFRSLIHQDDAKNANLCGGPSSPVNVELYAFIQPMIANFVEKSLEKIYKTQIREASGGFSRTGGMDTRVVFREFNETQRSSVCSMVFGTYTYNKMVGSSVRMLKSKYILARENPYHSGNLFLGDGDDEKIHVLDCMVTVQNSHDFQHLYVAADPNSLVALFLVHNKGDDMNVRYQLTARMDAFDNLKYFYCSSTKHQAKNERKICD